MTKRKHNEITDDREFTNVDFNKVKSYLSGRLSERSTPKKLFGLQKEYDRLYQLLNQTIHKGESNSCLVIGNRGTGKTTLIKLVLDDLSKKFPKGFVTVKLNGLTETSDRLALNEIARQLMTIQGHIQHQKRTFVREK